MKKQTDTFKRLRAVMKDINGDHRQIIKTMQIYLKYRYLVYHFLTCPVRDKKGDFAIGVSVRSMVGYATCPVEVSTAVKVAVTKFEYPKMFQKL